MWQGWSLRTRLNALFGGFLALGLLVSIGWILLTAGARVKAEDESSVRLARELIESSVISLKEIAVPGDALEHLMDGLNNLRHVAITIERGSVEEARRNHSLRASELQDVKVPRWFAALVHPERTTVTVPVQIEARNYGVIVISSNPQDESEEVWETLTSLTMGGVLLVLVVFGFNNWVIGRALEPIGKLGAAMTTLESGQYAIKVPLTGAPELMEICSKLNSLAGTLDQTTRDNLHLSEMLVTLQDDERKELARELHDEFGPYLFAIRAGVNSLQRRFDTRGDAPESRALCLALQEQVDALQKINRRVLERLRPAAMTELGLTEALRALVAMWGETYPAVAVEMELPDDLDDLDETLALTVFRIVQEGLTNVFRHSGATKACIDIRHDMNLGVGHSGEGLRLRINDDGVGLPNEHVQGFGLLGMRERVLALQGKMTARTAPEGGVVIEVLLPADAAWRTHSAPELHRETFPN